jgi:PAS domain S-box-containing protein
MDEKGHLLEAPVETLRAILEHSPDVVTLLTADGTLLYLNRTFPPLTLDQVIGTNAADYIAEEHRPKWKDALRRLVDTGAPQRIEVVTPTPARVWETRLVPLTSAPPAVAMGIGRDVTELRNLESDLRHAHKMQAIGQLTAGVAHNFNNLLTAILPNLELAATAPPAQARAHRRDAEAAARTAAEMVHQLMLFARRQRPPPEAPVDLREVVDHAVALCRPALDWHVLVEWSRPAGAHPVRADAWSIEQAILNVLLNARDAIAVAGPQRPRIDIGLDREGGMHRIRVRDNGCGMDEATRQRVFEPFFTTKEVGHGTGLGLSSAYAILEEHWGRISCESALGAGTTISLWLPG